MKRIFIAIAVLLFSACLGKAQACLYAKLHELRQPDP